VIPEDIMKTAREVADATVNRFLDLGMMTVVPNAERKLVAKRIARALLAERERCNEHHKAEFARLQELHGFL